MQDVFCVVDAPNVSAGVLKCQTQSRLNLLVGVEDRHKRCRDDDSLQSLDAAARSSAFDLPTC